MFITIINEYYYRYVKVQRERERERIGALMKEIVRQVFVKEQPVARRERPVSLSTFRKLRWKDGRASLRNYRQ